MDLDFVKADAEKGSPPPPRLHSRKTSGNLLDSLFLNLESEADGFSNPTAQTISLEDLEGYFSPNPNGCQEEPSPRLDSKKSPIGAQTIMTSRLKALERDREQDLWHSDTDDVEAFMVREVQQSEGIAYCCFRHGSVLPNGDIQEEPPPKISLGCRSKLGAMAETNSDSPDHQFERLFSQEQQEWVVPVLKETESLLSRIILPFGKQQLYEFIDSHNVAFQERGLGWFHPYFLKMVECAMLEKNYPENFRRSAPTQQVKSPPPLPAPNIFDWQWQRLMTSLQNDSRIRFSRKEATILLPILPFPGVRSQLRSERKRATAEKIQSDEANKEKRSKVSRGDKPYKIWRKNTLVQHNSFEHDCTSTTLWEVRWRNNKYPMKNVISHRILPELLML